MNPYYRGLQPSDGGDKHCNTSTTSRSTSLNSYSELGWGIKALEGCATHQFRDSGAMVLSIADVPSCY